MSYDGASDLSSDSDDNPAEDSISPGDVVWAKYGRTWYPGKVAASYDIPPNQQRNFVRCKGDNSVVIGWHGVNMEGLGILVRLQLAMIYPLTNRETL